MAGVSVDAAAMTMGGWVTLAIQERITIGPIIDVEDPEGSNNGRLYDMKFFTNTAAGTIRAN